MSTRTLRKRDMALAIAAELGEGTPTRMVLDVIDEYHNQIENQIGQGNRIELRGIGVFSPRFSGPRMGKNLNTGEDVPIPPRLIVKFKPSPLSEKRTTQAMLQPRLPTPQELQESLV
jgi:nucleoid DNA-binding protein